MTKKTKQTTPKAEFIWDDDESVLTLKLVGEPPHDFYFTSKAKAVNMVKALRTASLIEEKNTITRTPIEI